MQYTVHKNNNSLFVKKILLDPYYAQISERKREIKKKGERGGNEGFYMHNTAACYSIFGTNCMNADMNL